MQLVVYNTQENKCADWDIDWWNDLEVTRLRTWQIVSGRAECRSVRREEREISAGSSHRWIYDLFLLFLPRRIEIRLNRMIWTIFHEKRLGTHPWLKGKNIVTICRFWASNHKHTNTLLYNMRAWQQSIPSSPARQLTSMHRRQWDRWLFSGEVTCVKVMTDTGLTVCVWCRMIKRLAWTCDKHTQTGRPIGRHTHTVHSLKKRNHWRIE